MISPSKKWYNYALRYFLYNFFCDLSRKDQKGGFFANKIGHVWKFDFLWLWNQSAVCWNISMVPNFLFIYKWISSGLYRGGSAARTFIGFVTGTVLVLVLWPYQTHDLVITASSPNARNLEVNVAGILDYTYKKTHKKTKVPCHNRRWYSK